MRIRLLAAALGAVISMPAAAATGDIDLGFGAGGVRAVAFDLGGDDQDTPRALVEIDTSHQFVAVGSATTAGPNGSYRVGAVAGLSEDGEMLGQFDGDGRAFYDFNPGFDTVFSAVSKDPSDDGLFVAAGFTHDDGTTANHSAVVRAMDLAGGQWITRRPPEELELAGIQHDFENRQYGVGAIDSGADTDFYVLRMYPDWTLDGNFSPTGDRRIAFDLNGPHIDYAVAVAPYPDGGAVIAGNAQYDGADFDFAVVKLQEDGEFDMLFSEDGKRSVGFDLPGGNDNDRLVAVAVDSQSRIVLAGTASRTANGTDTDIALTRLLPNGNIDLNFGVDGRLVTSFDAADPTKKDELAAMLIQPDGRIWLLGTRHTGDPLNVSDVALMRLTANGEVDTTFGSGDGVRYYGFSQDSPGGRDTGAAIMMQRDGKLVLLASKEFNGTDTDFVMTRVFNDFDPNDVIFRSNFDMIF
jgi:uncharacterized delta-60 repeat protein